MRRWVPLCLVLVADAARAEDAPPQVPAPVMTLEQAADAALAAREDAGLRMLATKDDPDPWLVADELLRRGEFGAAAAFARAAPRPDVEALPGYVETQRGRAPEDAERARLSAVNAALKAGEFQKALEGTETIPAPADTVLRVRLHHSRGAALGRLRRMSESAIAYRVAADAAAALGWLRRASDTYQAAEDRAWEAGERRLSLELADAGLGVWERRGDSGGVANTFGRIGFAQMVLGNLAEAQAAYEKALARFEQTDEKLGRAWVLSNSAELLRRQGEHAKRLALLRRALPLFEEQVRPGHMSNALAFTWIAYNALGEHAQALAFYERTLPRMVAAGDKAGEGATRVHVGHAALALGDVARAAEYHERGRALLEEVGNPDWLVDALGSMGRMQREFGRYAQALSTWEALIRHQRSWGQTAAADETMQEVCRVYFDRGEFAKAVKAYKQALERLEARGERAGAGYLLNQLGLAYYNLGDYALALSTYEDALARFESRGEKRNMAAVLVNMGSAYTKLADHPAALAHLRRGLGLFGDAQDRQGWADALSNIGNLLLSARDVGQARGIFEQTLEEYRALGDASGVASMLTNLGIAHTRLGDPTKALELHREALVLNEARGDFASLAMDHVSMGDAYLALGDLDQARVSYERSTSVARSRRLTDVLVIGLMDLAELHLKRSEAALAVASAREALRETEVLLRGLGDLQGATARTRWIRLYATGALAAAREGDTAALFTFLESGRAGALLDDLDAREALRWKDQSLPPELARLDDEAQVKERAARVAYDLAVQKAGGADRREAGRALDEASRRVQEVAARIQRTLKQQANFFYPRARTSDETRGSLRADQALVLYGLCQDEALALVLRPDGERIVPLGPAADVVAACEALEFRNSDTDPGPALDLLKKRLVEPLQLEAGVRQILVSPDGPLAYLPFALLFERGVAMTPSGTTHGLLLDEDVGPGQGILALGDPDYEGVSRGAQAIYYRGRPLKPLPATRAEVSAISARPLLGAEASETKLREVLPTSARWRAIHFACHGLINTEKPMLSSLALSRAEGGDGFLTALEVLRTKIPADLVVLSACETATGKIVSGEGIVGLTRAFMFAGTPRVICSLWKVDDEATQALMVRFYELWNPKDGKRGLATAEALRQAQEFVRSQEKWKHPYYWAAWVLWGLPD